MPSQMWKSSLWYNALARKQRPWPQASLRNIAKLATLAYPHGAAKLAMAFTIRLLCFPQCSATSFCVAQTNGSIAVGASLTANAEGNSSSSWLSPSGDFAFGIFSLGSNGLVLLSICTVWAEKSAGCSYMESGTVLCVAQGVMNDYRKTLFFKIEIQKSVWEPVKQSPMITLLPGQTHEKRETSGTLRLDQSGENNSSIRTVPADFCTQMGEPCKAAPKLPPIKLANDSTSNRHDRGESGGSEGRELVVNVQLLYVLERMGWKVHSAVGRSAQQGTTILSQLRNVKRDCAITHYTRARKFSQDNGADFFSGQISMNILHIREYR
ncbi:unnamed protein product [Prunus armeniaca]|uniref:Uncharacterized protein n=1 Tax=Prunus armeniaca TaxID=36596 RepID=A0A6J5XDY6_PRUAR|nr:unnamed protein product [Prunus armeniaca]